MTPFQLLLLAHAPCSSTMVGLGPPPAPAGLPVRAEANWLTGMTSPAMAATAAMTIRRSRRTGVIAVMFMKIFPSWHDERARCGACGEAAECPGGPVSASHPHVLSLCLDRDGGVSAT